MAWVSVGALSTLALSMALCIARAVRGPSLFDRVLALDCIVLDMVGTILLISKQLDVAAYMDVVIVVSLLGFVGTVALASYLEGTLG